MSGPNDGEPGMSLRDYFAAHADPAWTAAYVAGWTWESHDEADRLRQTQRLHVEARWAYADAMLKAREPAAKPEPKPGREGRWACRECGAEVSISETTSEDPDRTGRWRWAALHGMWLHTCSGAVGQTMPEQAADRIGDAPPKPPEP